MSNTNDQLSRRDQLLIESYKEQAAAWKHEDRLLHRFTAVILPLSIAALGLPFLNNNVPALLANFGGLTLMTFWVISCNILYSKSNLRFSIINEIERGWDIQGHKDFLERRDNTYGKKLKSHFLRCCMYWVYVITVIMLTSYRWYKMYPTQWTLITEVIVTLVLIVSFGILAAWAMRTARKKVCTKDKEKTEPSEKESG